MTEINQQQGQTADAPEKVRRSRTGVWFGIITLVTIFAIAGAGYYFFMQLRERQEGLGGEVKGELSKQIHDYQAQLNAIQNQLAALQADIAGKDTHFTKTVADFSQLHSEKLDSTRKELNDSIRFIQRQLGKTRGDWLMADAEYLLSIANERLHLIGDINTTKEALEAADQRLRESGDSGAIKIREEIAKEIAMLRGIEVPDMVGLFAAIQTLESRVDKLDLFLPYSGKPFSQSSEPAKTVEDTAPDAEPAEHNELLDSAIAKLQGVVTIRHSDQPITEILTPEQAQFIREQLRFKLEMVKVSLVQQKEGLYVVSIADAKAWIGQHFRKNEEANLFLGELDRFNAVKISSHFPDISLSLKMLRDITKLRLETDKGVEYPAQAQEKQADKIEAATPTAPVAAIPNHPPVTADTPAADKPEEIKPEETTPAAAHVPKE